MLSLRKPKATSRTRRGIRWLVFLLITVVGVGLITQSLSTHAQAPAAKPSLAAFNQAMAKENYTEAKRQADALLPQSQPEQRFYLSLAYGRVLLGLKQKEDAQKYLALMSKQNLPGDGPRLLEVYKAWYMALDDKQEEAIKALETILEQNVHSIATAEAADVLAMLYLVQGDRKNAQRAVDFGLKFLGYAMLKTDYTEALLRGRMKSTVNSPEAEKLYVAAEKLRQEQKFVEAGKLFNQICQQYAQTEWVHPAQFRIGQCLVGLGRGKQAQQHWQGFVKGVPAGPWRGQTYVALIDLGIELDGDLKAASEHSLTATTTLSQTLEEEAKKSWEAASFDIQLRHGILALVDSRFEAAVTALKQARQNAPSNRNLVLGLDRLIESAEKRTPLLPEEVNTGDPKSIAALSLGTVFNTLRQFEPARRFFLAPLSSTGRRASSPHRSFAMFGLARAVAGLAGPYEVAGAAKPTGDSPPTFDQAKSLYQQSLKEFNGGTWHDETFRDLALLIERMAADKFVNRPRAAALAKQKESGESPARPSDAERQEQARQLSTARLEALVSWASIPKQFPSSRHVPQAYYHAGVLLSEGDKPAEALATFSELVKKFPNSPWTGDAQVWLIDVKLEQQFDLPGAVSLAVAAIDWYEKLDPNAVAKSRQGYAEDEAQGLSTLKQVGYNIYLRAGLVEYLREHPKQATNFFDQAKPLAPPSDYVVAVGTIPSGLEKLIDLAKKGIMITPDIVRAGNEKSKLILMLADVYHEGEQWNKSLELCNKVIDSSRHGTSKDQLSWAYFKRGRNYFCLEKSAFNPEAALSDYGISVRTAPTSPWANQATFLAANIQWNQMKRVDEAIQLWRTVLLTYPDSKETDRSAYYIAVAYEWSKRPREARLAYEQFVKERPKSGFAAEAHKRLAELKRRTNGKQ